MGLAAATRNPDDTESGEDEPQSQHEASRPAGPAASPRGGEREGEDGSAARRGRAGGVGTNGDPSSSQSFAEVRALLWRREWMKSQIELLTLQREQLSQSLSRVESEKAPILLSAAPANKRKRAAEANAVICGEASANDATSASTAGQVSSAAGAAGAHTMHAAKQGTGAGADEAAKAGGGGGYGCVREVDWEVVLGGRRCKLVQAALPLEVLAKMHAESKKRYRARDGLSALRDSNFFLGKERPKTHKEIAAARAQAAAQQQLQTPVSDVKGNVTNGGRKLVTSSGQKVIIKFSAKNPGLSPRTPTPQVKNGRNGLTPRGTADTPVSSHKKQRGMLGLMDSKVSRAMDSPRNNKQDWGLDEYVYGGAKTHTQIETVKAKDIYVPKWFVIEEEPENKVEGESSGGGGARLSRSLTVGSKYAKAKPAARSNGHADGESSEECTDDEVYLTRHKPFEEQEFRFRHPKFLEREKNHKEALKKEGSVYNNAEDAYKSLWYRGDKTEDSKESTNGIGCSPVLGASPNSPHPSSLDKKSPRAPLK